MLAARVRPLPPLTSLAPFLPSRPSLHPPPLYLQPPTIETVTSKAAYPKILASETANFRNRHFLDFPVDAPRLGSLRLYG